MTDKVFKICTLCAFIVFALIITIHTCRDMKLYRLLLTPYEIDSLYNSSNGWLYVTPQEGIDTALPIPEEPIDTFKFDSTQFTIENI